MLSYVAALTAHDESARPSASASRRQATPVGPRAALPTKRAAPAADCARAAAVCRHRGAAPRPAPPGFASGCPTVDCPASRTSRGRRSPPPSSAARKRSGRTEAGSRSAAEARPAHQTRPRWLPPARRWPPARQRRAQCGARAALARWSAESRPAATAAPRVRGHARDCCLLRRRLRRRRLCRLHLRRRRLCRRQRRAGVPSALAPQCSPAADH